MQETLQALKGLQELDGDLFRVNRELERLPQERERRRAALEGKGADLATLTKRTFEKRIRLKELEDLVRVDRQRIRKLEGEVQTARDASLIAAFQHEIRTLKRSIGEVDDEGLRFLEELETLDAERAKLAADVEAEKKAFAEYCVNVEAEIADATKRRDLLRSGRNRRLSGGLEPGVLSRYERLLEAREGVALVALEGRICQGCYMEVPSNVFVKLSRSTEIVSCPSCDRILYLIH